jgi:hypothetical protein
VLNPINVKYWELAHTLDNLGSHKSDDYSARCDVCGDSHKKKNSKRLHLYTKSSYDGDHVKCFNGDCSQNSSMYTYLKNYHPNLVSSYSQEIGNTNITKLANYNSSPVLTINEVKKKNTLSIFDKPSSLIMPNHDVVNYIKSRGFTKEILSNPSNKDFKVFLSQGIISLPNKNGKNGKNGNKDIMLKDYIIIPLLENGKWYGFYSRSIHTKKFHTYIPEENTGYKLWNFFNVNKKDTVYIFEAIFNAMSTSFPAIACLGSDIDEERLKELSKPVFVFDNDETGRNKALKYANKGYPVVVYPNEMRFNQDLKDINDFLKHNYTVADIDKFIIDNTYSGILAITLLTLQNAR